MRRTAFGIVAGCALLAWAGCVGGPGEPTSSEDHGLLELDVPVEGVIDERVWRHVPVGCEGRIDEDDIRHIARAENAPELGVVLDDDGDPVCVDTLESIAIELERLQGDPSPDPMYPKMLR